MAARVSFDSRGWWMVLAPGARAAMAMARIVWDFEPGISTVPLSWDGLQINFIGYRW